MNAAGKLNVDYPMVQPYDLFGIYRKISVSEDSLAWYNALSGDLLKHAGYDDRHEKVQLFISPDNKLRYSGGSISDYPRIDAGVKYIDKNWHLSIGANYDREYFHDPTFYGRNSEFIAGRVDNSFIEYSHNKFKLFFGRTSRNLGLIDDFGLALSDNSYSYDHLSLQYRTKLFNYFFLTTRLDDINGLDVRDEEAVRKWNKRYFSLHRFDFRISDELYFGFTESVLYGGPNQGFLWYYLNPIPIYWIAENNQERGNKENDSNLQIALDIYWKPAKKITVFSQLMVDDIDFKKENRNRFPSRLGGQVILKFADLLTKHSQFILSWTRIENWTYTSFFDWGNYLYHNRSLGYPENSVDKYTLAFNFFGIEDVVLSAILSYKEKGEQSLTSPFYAVKTKFPIGTVEETLGAGFDVTYLWNNSFALNAVFNFNGINNFQHIPNHTSSDIFFSINFNYYIGHKVLLSQ